ncbi:unannotated protein [freshwater metagenome]|uniref:Unannotated protein n=1 Tax=freshwater metagenome TaxID=449393 RepID=A0A6J7EVC6_9ZZZZ|nr:hypothetical protein [Actinomycetota bacterium]
MKRKTFDKIVTTVGAGLAAFLFVIAGLANWGASFASDSVSSQLEAQLITFPAATGNSAESADVTAYFKEHGGKLMTTGKDAQMYADHYIAFHMSKMPTYSEAADAARTATPDKKAAADATVETVFKGNMLRGTLLTAYAFGTLGSLAGYGAIAALVGGLLMLVLTLAGIVHIRRTPEHATI